MRVFLKINIQLEAEGKGLVTGGFVGEVPVVEAEVVFETRREVEGGGGGRRIGGSGRSNGRAGRGGVNSTRDETAEVEVEEPALAVAGGDTEGAGGVAFVEV